MLPCHGEIKLIKKLQPLNAANRLQTSKGTSLLAECIFRELEGTVAISFNNNSASNILNLISLN